MHDTVPMPLYLVGPSLAVTTLISIKVILPLGINVYEVANLVKQGYQKNLHLSGDIRHMKRRERAIRVLRLYGGLGQFDMYPLKRSTKSTYFNNILNYTINICLAVDGQFNFAPLRDKCLSSGKFHKALCT